MQGDYAGYQGINNLLALHLIDGDIRVSVTMRDSSSARDAHDGIVIDAQAPAYPIVLPQLATRAEHRYAH